MNFNWLISHIGSAWAFWGLGVGGLVTSGAAIALWLRHSGMYGGRREKRRVDESSRDSLTNIEASKGWGSSPAERATKAAGQHLIPGDRQGPESLA
jgi:hypothetical protein